MNKQMKVCRTCLVEKRPTDFYPSRTTRDGRHGECKECMIGRVKTKNRLKRENAIRFFGLVLALSMLASCSRYPYGKAYYQNNPHCNHKKI